MNAGWMGMVTHISVLCVTEGRVLHFPVAGHLQGNLQATQGRTLHGGAIQLRDSMEGGKSLTNRCTWIRLLVVITIEIKVSLPQKSDLHLLD